MRAASPHGLGLVLVVVFLAVLVAAHARPPPPFANRGPAVRRPGPARGGGAPTPAEQRPTFVLALDLPSGRSALSEAAGQQALTAAHPDFITIDLEPQAGAQVDPRFASVVLIEPARGFGSGFYIAPHWVLTNVHVVDEAEVVRVTAYDGTVSSGQVVRRDRERDLALIHVDQPGRPAGLFTGPALQIGSPVEAIGHPAGFRYSLTRGVVSAVRRRAGVAGVERRRVLHIQTDAIINLGNSGGPLFMGDQVVGVTAWRWGSNGGLSFAVHYREVLDFLAESAALPGLVAQKGL
jgi:S1-C subfamily serine protease